MQRLSTTVTSLVATAALALCAGLLWPTRSIALENLTVVRGVLILEGRIEAGDFARVRNFLSEPINFKHMTGEVFLASQGGNVFEALEIGYLIRHLQLSTDAPSLPPPTARSSGAEIIRPLDLANPRHYQCISACFLLYVAGVYREFIWAGRLGIHRPRVERQPIGATEKDIAIAMAEMRNKVKGYLEEMDVPHQYLDLMYSVPANEVHWITQDEFNADLKGYIPELRSILDAKCNLGSASENSKELRDCMVRTKAERRTEAWRKLFHRQ